MKGSSTTLDGPARVDTSGAKLQTSIDGATLGVVEEHVEIAWHMAERSQQQGDLTAVMDSMDGPVLHQLSYGA
jgi:hypothetical protein